MVEPHSPSDENAVTPIAKKRRWLRYSVRGMLIVTVMAALFARWYLSSEPVIYHDSVANWETVMWETKRWQGPNGIRSPTVTWLSSPKNDPLHISYEDDFGNGRIRIRRQVLYEPKRAPVAIISIDSDRDGYFDVEEHRHLKINGKAFGKDWSRKIHTPVPKTTP